MAIPVFVAALSGSSTLAQQPDEGIDADRPHVGTGTHLVAPGELQFEIGGQAQRFGTTTLYASPVLVRVGLTDRVEARVATDGVVGSRAGTETTTSVGNAQLGAKIRLVGESASPLFSIMAAVTLGLASAEKGLGSGETDVAVTLLLAREMGDRLHVEANYGIGAIGGGEGRDRFAQHLITAAGTMTLTRKMSSFVEIASWSRQQIDGGAFAFTDFGAMYSVTPRAILDAGIAIGVTRDAPDYAVFAGITFALGSPRRSQPAHNGPHSQADQRTRFSTR